MFLVCVLFFHRRLRSLNTTAFTTDSIQVVDTVKTPALSRTGEALLQHCHLRMAGPSHGGLSLLQQCHPHHIVHIKGNPFPIPPQNRIPH